MANPDIGHVDCPWCGEPASVREDRKGKAYVLCESVMCGSQTFFRADKGAAPPRKIMRPVAAVQPDPAPGAPPVKTPVKKKAAPAAPARVATVPNEQLVQEDFPSWLKL